MHKSLALAKESGVIARAWQRQRLKTCRGGGSAISWLLRSKQSLTLLVMIFAGFAFLMLVAAPVLGQVVCVGVKAGMPLTDLVRTTGEIGGSPFRANTNRFTVGPALDFRLPLGLGVEFGAMYKRFDQQAGQVQVIAEPSTPYRVEYSSYARAGGSWEFPILGQYRFLGKTARPYVEAGFSFNHLSDVFAPFRTLVSQSAILVPSGRSENRRGLVMGAGVEIRLAFVYLVPGLRYTHYGDTHSWLPSASAVDFLVGFTFRGPGARPSRPKTKREGNF